MYNSYYQPTQSQTQASAYLSQPQMPIRQSLNLKGRPVTSIDEARASTIDFDGTVFYFPDLANKKIYTKQINLDGTSTLLMYELKEIPATPEAPAFVTREEFEDTINQLKGLLVAAAPSQETPIQPQVTQTAPPAEYKF